MKNTKFELLTISESHEISGGNPWVFFSVIMEAFRDGFLAAGPCKCDDGAFYGGWLPEVTIKP